MQRRFDNGRGLVGLNNACRSMIQMFARGLKGISINSLHFSRNCLSLGPIQPLLENRVDLISSLFVLPESRSHP
jgi:hypothetical protein